MGFVEILIWDVGFVEILIWGVGFGAADFFFLLGFEMFFSSSGFAEKFLVVGILDLQRWRKLSFGSSSE